MAVNDSFTVFARPHEMRRILNEIGYLIENYIDNLDLEYPVEGDEEPMTLRLSLECDDASDIRHRD